MDSPRYQAKVKIAVFAVSVVVMVIIGHAGSMSAGLPPKCGDYRLFYDHVTEQCEPCSEVCEKAEIQGTQEQCLTNCPRFVQAMKCAEKEGWYYDELYNSCKSCCDLCNTSSEPRPLCWLKCAGFLDDRPALEDLAPFGLPSSQTAGVPAPSSLPLLPCPPASETPQKKAPLPPSNTTPHAHSHWIVIAIVVITAVILISIITIVTAFAVMHVNRVKERKEVREDRARADLLCPVEESSKQQQALTTPLCRPSAAVLAGDGTVRTMTVIPVVPKTAFADLSLGHNASRRERV